MEDMKQAMRSGDKKTLETIRFVIAKIKNTEIDKGELSDKEVEQIIAKQIKEMKEVFADYEKAGRHDLVEADQEKVTVLAKYLPEQLSDSEIEALIDQAMAESPDGHMGKVIGAVNQKAAGRADGAVIAQKVRARFQ